MISPSSLHRAMACPGSVKLSADKPNFSTPAAQRGTAIHALLAASLVANDSDIIDASHLPPEDRELCDDAWGQIMQYVDDRDEILSEVQLELEKYGMERTGRDGEHQADVVILTPSKGGKGGYSHAFVIDLKTGKTPVQDPARNVQLAAYALGVRDKFKPRKITVGICQPTLYSGVKFALWPRPALKTFEGELAKTVALAASGKTFQDGAHCLYCPAKGVCPLKEGEKAQKKAVGAKIKALVTGSQDVSVKANIKGDLVVINAETVKAAHDLALVAKALDVTTETASRAGDLLTEITKLEKAVDKQRAEIKRPVLDLGKQIDSEAKKALEPLRDGKAILKEGIAMLDETPTNVKTTETLTWKVRHGAEVPGAYWTIDEKAIDRDVKAGKLKGAKWLEITTSKSVSSK